MRDALFVIGLLLFGAAAMMAALTPMPYRVVPAIFGGMISVSLYLQFTRVR